MELTGHIENGVVVFDGGTPPPEGTRVTVVTEEKPVVFGDQRRQVPVLQTSDPGNWRLTNEQIEEMFIKNRPYVNDEGKLVLTNDMIHDIFEEDDIRSAMGVWNEPDEG